MKTNCTWILMPILMLTLASCSNANNEATAQSSTLITNYSYSADELELIRIINEYRVSNELPEFELINHISHVSQQHNVYMIENNVVNHGNFTARANNLKEILGAVTVGENIAYNFSTPQSALDAWLNSPEHKENLDGDFSHFGLSISTSPTGKKYYTNMFIKR